MSLIPKELARQIRIPAYVVTAYSAVGSILDILMSTWPVHVHDLRWRLAVESLATGATGTELLAVLLFLAFAWAAADQIALGVGFAFALIVGVFYLCGSVAFGLDALQVRSQIAPDQISRFQIGAAWAFGRMVFTGLMLGFLAAAIFRAFRSLARVADRGVAPGVGNLIVSKPPVAPSRASI